MSQEDRSQLSRRGFVQSAALAAGLASAAPSKAEVKIGLYSITYGGVWYRGDALTVEQVIERAHRFGYQGVEIDGKRPHGNPLDMPKARCRELRKMAADQGIEIYGVSGNNDFSSPIPEHRETQLVYARELMRMTADLGAKAMRVFLAWPGVTLRPEGGGRYDIAQAVWKAEHQDFSEERTWSWCRETLEEAARLAGDFGVVLALQNHGPVIRGYADCLRMVKEVGSPHLKICFDARLEHSLDEAGVRKAVNEVGGCRRCGTMEASTTSAPAASRSRATRSVSARCSAFSISVIKDTPDTSFATPCRSSTARPRASISSIKTRSSPPNICAAYSRKRRSSTRAPKAENSRIDAIRFRAS